MAFARLFWSNDQDLRSEVLSQNGVAITGGTVEAEIFDIEGVTSLIAKAVMAHIGSPDGTWSRTLQAETIDAGIARTVPFVLERITVGSPVDATFERLLQMAERRTGS